MLPSQSPKVPDFFDRPHPSVPSPSSSQTSCHPPHRGSAVIAILVLPSSSDLLSLPFLPSLLVCCRRRSDVILVVVLSSIDVLPLLSSSCCHRLPAVPHQRPPLPRLPMADRMVVVAQSTAIVTVAPSTDHSNISTEETGFYKSVSWWPSASSVTSNDIWKPAVIEVNSQFAFLVLALHLQPDNGTWKSVSASLIDAS
ncbi:hypothetical protein ACLOJK_028903 [Asimina triloba]